MEKYKNIYRIGSTRLKNWDYGSPGFYFVTICTQHRKCYFGDITQNPSSIQLTAIGRVAQQYWTEIPRHFPFVRIDEFIVMPNHIHGILEFNKTDYRRHNKNSFSPQSENLASVIRGYKAGVKKYATLNTIEFIWQPRYHDHVIRSETRLNIIRQYIKNNPIKWTNKIIAL